LRIKIPALWVGLALCSLALAQKIHVVKSGENDYTIAHRAHITTHQLHILNPNTDWDPLRVGTKLYLAEIGPRHEAKATKKTPIVAKREAKKTPKNLVISGYRANHGDSDWTIARHFGTTPSAIRRMNPSIDWDDLKIGQVVIVPVDHVAMATSKIRGRYAVVGDQGAALREGPSRDTDMIVRLKEGLKATILDHQGQWYKCEMPKGSVGWIRGDLLRPARASEIAELRRSRRHHADEEDDQPTHRTAKRHHHSKERIARRHRRDRVVASNFAGDSSVVGTASRFIGERYRYGSNSRHATDCSGLVLQVYGAHGVHLPRTAHEQIHAGTPISARDLKPGDLVFFHTTRGARVGHVGIYKGNGEFIHASSGRGHVTISSLSEGYYQRRFVGARRVLRGGSSAFHKRRSSSSDDN
jgi:cell wall-associated NlpC family hydrolase/LysM repeat protein